MANHVNFTVDIFLKDFPEFVEEDAQILESHLERTKCYISTEDYGVINGKTRLLACELMMAHLLTINRRIHRENQTQAVSVSSASLGGVSVSLTPPSNRTQQEFWYNLTIYGTQLWSLLVTNTPVGFYVAGQPNRVLL